MFRFDFSLYGWQAALWKGLKIIGWYALSGAVTSLVLLASSYRPSEGQYLAVAAILIANVVLAAIGKWLTTCKPE